MKTKSLAIIAILLTSVVASAFVSLDISPHTQNIKVGKTVHYTLILNTDNIGPNAFQWATSSPNIVAGINGGPQSNVGTFKFISTGHRQTFTLDVTVQLGVVMGQEYHVHVQYLGQSGNVDAVVTADVVPAGLPG